MPDDIPSVPDDVLALAKLAAFATEVTGDDTAAITSFVGVRVIGNAILTERRRCAAVARHLNGWGADSGAGGHAEHIANIIESTP